MGKIGTVRNSQSKQRINAELETIIEEFARAMRNADLRYVSLPPACQHDNAPRFTVSMELAWSRYIEFCEHHPE